MPKRQIRKWKEAHVLAGALELGQAAPADARGPPAGKTVRIEFRRNIKGRRSTLGTLDIGAANLYWQGPNRRIWAKIPAEDLERIFKKYY